MLDWKLMEIRQWSSGLMSNQGRRLVLQSAVQAQHLVRPTLLLRGCRTGADRRDCVMPAACTQGIRSFVTEVNAA